MLDSGNVVDVPVTDLSTNVYVIADTAGMCLLNEECEVLELNVNCSLGVTAFSPNGDGINDFFEVDIVSVYPTNNMIIFNRYGDEVANIQNYNNIDLRWEGTGPDGLALPGGTYFYLFLDESGSEAARGWVTVLK